MAKARREPVPGHGLVLAVPEGSPHPPPLRFERIATRRWVLRQGASELIDAWPEGEGCCYDLHLRRVPGYRSPLPPLSAAAMRTGADWPHRYAAWLEESGLGPLHHGRWRMTSRTGFTPGIWEQDLVRDWPDATLEIYCGGGWHGVLPLRPLSPPDAARVKAYRKHAREGTLAPVLLWWVTFLDGWLLLDGHDRAAAALAEGMRPTCVELARVPDDAHWQADAARITEAHEERIEQLASDPESPQTIHKRRLFDQTFADTLSTLPFDPAPTPVFEPQHD